MTGTRGSRRGRRIIASVLVAAMLAGAIVTDQRGHRERGSGRYRGFAGLCLSGRVDGVPVLRLAALDSSTGWARRLADADSASGPIPPRLRRRRQRRFRGRGGMAGSVYRGGEPGALRRRKAPRSSMQLACIRSLNGDAHGAAQAAAEAATTGRRRRPASNSFPISSAWTRAMRWARLEALNAYAVHWRRTIRAMRRSPTFILEAGDYEESGRFYDLAMENDGETDQLALHARHVQHASRAAMPRPWRTLPPAPCLAALYSQGVCAMALGDLEQAEVCFSEAIERG